MWFRSRRRAKSELATQGKVYIEELGVSPPAAVAPTLYSVNDMPNPKSPAAEPKVPTASFESPVRSLQTRPVEPELPKRGASLVIAGGAPAEVYSSYNYLRTQVIQRLQENGWNTVAITSPSRDSGTTLTAINLAISMARSFNYTVLLVELDFVNPSFRKLLGFDQRHGVVDHLLHDMPVSEIILNPGIEGLVVMPAGSPVINSSELLCSPKMARLVEHLKARHEHQIVLFDLPSVLSSDDAMAFAPLVDCALLVVDEGKTRINEVRQALSYLRSTKLLGVVLNRSIHAPSDGKAAPR
jgi:protein-tyrosine kinase